MCLRGLNRFSQRQIYIRAISFLAYSFLSPTSICVVTSSASNKARGICSCSIRYRNLLYSEPPHYKLSTHIQHTYMHIVRTLSLSLLSMHKLALDQAGRNPAALRCNEKTLRVRHMHAFHHGKNILAKF